MKVHIDILTLEPGTHFARKTIDRQRLMVVELPDAECKEVRPDWGEYFPVVTFPAIERALWARNLFLQLPDSQRYSFGLCR